MARARGILSTILLIAVSAFALLTVVVPTVLGAQTYTVLTGSMNPGCRRGASSRCARRRSTPYAWAMS